MESIHKQLDVKLPIDSGAGARAAPQRVVAQLGEAQSFRNSPSTKSPVFVGYGNLDSDGYLFSPVLDCLFYSSSDLWSIF